MKRNTEEHLMKALITGGTSGIGRCMAEELLTRGYEVYIVSRKEGDLAKTRERFPNGKITFWSYDLIQEEECYRLLKESESIDFDLFINNAGYGDIGRITKTSLEKEVNMVKLNDIATLILVKSFLVRFIQKGKGRVLTVASAAAFGVAPYMNVYYATKAFVYSLAHGYYRELKDMKSAVSLSVLCPGPVKTRFEEVANAKFTIGSITPEQCAKTAIQGLLKGKFEIVPSFKIKLGHVFAHLLPKKWISRILRKQSEMKD